MIDLISASFSKNSQGHDCVLYGIKGILLIKESRFSGILQRNWGGTAITILAFIDS